MFISQLQYHMSYINQDRIYQLQFNTVVTQNMQKMYHITACIIVYVHCLVAISG